MAFFSRKVNIEKKDILKKPLPKHIAIIMDGNGRWATKRGLPRVAGHRAGVESLKNIVEFCLEINIPYLTVYAFSTENWKRPREEVNTLMNLMVEYIQKELEILDKNGVRINPIGKLDDLPVYTLEYITNAYLQTKNNNRLVLNVALNYGGRAEIIQAVRMISENVKKGILTIDEVNENLFSQYLYTTNQPDPDLMIRPSGEMRISNFLLWQLAYTELWVTNVLWPDFKPHHLIKAIYDFQNRERRFGGLNLN
ncbi:MAG: undecaprenyl diphosphate synthase [Clostridia bacterium]|jgi:undecaprenyl diphosphate synthase|nr:undecaprenyl diphosphate synthase [Clostridia bacterium]